MLYLKFKIKFVIKKIKNEIQLEFYYDHFTNYIRFSK